VNYKGNKMKKCKFWVSSSKFQKEEKIVEIDEDILKDEEEMELLAEEKAAEIYGGLFYVTDALISYGWETIEG